MQIQVRNLCMHSTKFCMEIDPSVHICNPNCSLQPWNLPVGEGTWLTLEYAAIKIDYFIAAYYIIGYITHLCQIRGLIMLHTDVLAQLMEKLGLEHSGACTIST